MGGVPVKPFRVVIFPEIPREKFEFLPPTQRNTLTRQVKKKGARIHVSCMCPRVLVRAHTRTSLASSYISSILSSVLTLGSLQALLRLS